MHDFAAAHIEGAEEIGLCPAAASLRERIDSRRFANK
jgi:hypothetical protein